MEYKVGDKVRIVKRTRPESNYPFSFIDEMASLAGKIFTITLIMESKDSLCSINEDYHLYHLDGEGKSWNWHSSMFEPVESSELKVGDTVRVISKGFDEGHHLLYPEMKYFLGGIFKVTHVNYHSDGNHAYCLDGDAKGWFWPISALEKVSDNADEIEVDAETEAFLKEISTDAYPDNPVLIGCSDFETSASIYISPIKVIL